jgi:tetratricopeptide (TPR) repeat protein
MAGYMPSDVFEAGAYAIASIHVSRSMSLVNAVDIVYDQYKSSYEDDNIRQQWMGAAEAIIGLTQQRFPNLTRAELTDLLEYLVNVVMAYEPSGTKRKKKFFGGTRFNKEKSPNFARQERLQKNFPKYLSLLDKQYVQEIAEDLANNSGESQANEVGSREAAFRLMEAGEFAKALEILLSLSKTETDWNLSHLIGQCYRHLEDLDKALRWLHKAKSANPRDSQVLLSLGIVYQLQGQFDRAEKALRKSIEYEPTNFSAYNSLGLTYRLHGQFEEALNSYEKAAEGIVYVGYETIKRNFTRESLVDGERTLEVQAGFDDALLETLRSNPMYATVQNNIGICLAEMGQIDAARERFSESIRTTPPGYDYPAPREALRMLDGDF